jgi:hypothetical protein
VKLGSYGNFYGDYFMLENKDTREKFENFKER